MNPESRRIGWVRLAVYFLYATYGVLVASSTELPLCFVEGHQLTYQVYRAWTDPSFGRIVSVPQFWGELGAVFQYFFMVPFLAMLGPNWMAFRLAALPWNLLGLRLVEKSLGDEKTGLLAVALIAFGSPVSTEFYLYPYGGYTSLLLPFGLLLFLTRRFFLNAGAMTRLQAAGSAVVATFLPLLSIAIGPWVVTTALYTLAKLAADIRRRLLPSLVAGSLAGTAVFLFIYSRQHHPTANMGLFNPLGYWLRLLFFVTEDLPDFLSIRGWGGYPLFALFGLSSALFVWKSRRSTDYLWAVVGLMALTGPLWVYATQRHVPGLAGPEYIRLRHFSIFWLPWAVMLAIASAKAAEMPPWAKAANKAALGLCVVFVATGLGLSFGQVNYAKLGVTRYMPLNTETGRLISEVFDPWTYETPEKLIGALTSLPPDIRDDAAFLFSIDTVLHLPVWGFGVESDRGQPFDYEPKTYVARHWLSPALVPPELAEPYWTGAGFFACEGSLRFSPEAEADLIRLKERVGPEFGQRIDRGCTLAKRYRRGEITFAAIQWPLESRIIPTGSAELISRIERFRTKPFGWIRLPL